MAKTPLDHALDLLVYAPLGAVVAARDALPDLIDKGRDRVSGQVSAARMMGQLAVSQGQREAEKAMSQATRRLVSLGLLPEAWRRSPCAEPAPGDSTEGQAGESRGPVAEAVRSEAPHAAADVASPPAISAEDLAIPGYDALSAPQVVQRLAGLSSEELDAVRQYESATRHRKTILTRIAQLQSPEQP